MALKFQPPNTGRAPSPTEAFISGVQPAVQGLPQQILSWQQFKHQKQMAQAQHDLEIQKLALQKRQLESQYGTGAPAPMNPGTMTPTVPQVGPEEQMFGQDATMPTPAAETPEEQQARLGTERYGQLHPAPTTLYSPTGEVLGSASGKVAVLPQPKTTSAKDELGLTPGQEQTDKEFGKDYEEFAARGGYADVQKNLDQLREVEKKLGTGEAKTGLMSGLLSKLPNSKARATKEAVQEVVQRNLRLVLGSQFTEREGNALISRAYNEFQPPEENKRRLGRLIKQIGDAAEAKQRAGQYFEKNGTLKGFKGTLYTSPSDFLQDNESDGKPSAAPSIGEMFNGHKVLSVKRIE